jgi:hypothetical protein
MSGSEMDDTDLIGYPLDPQQAEHAVSQLSIQVPDDRDMGESANRTDDQNIPFNSPLARTNRNNRRRTNTRSSGKSVSSGQQPNFPYLVDKYTHQTGPAHWILDGLIGKSGLTPLTLDVASHMLDPWEFNLYQQRRFRGESPNSINL